MGKKKHKKEKTAALRSLPPDSQTSPPPETVDYNKELRRLHEEERHRARGAERERPDLRLALRPLAERA